MENPGALAGATGVGSNERAFTPTAYQREDYPGNRKSIGSLADTARHRAVAKMLRIALTLAANRFTADGRMAAWVDFAKVLVIRLSEEERALLAYWALRTLSPEVRVAIMDGAHLGGTS
jgi:hypothetical protein